MSFARTALRLAAVMALSNGYKAPFPTRAGALVYDSRVDPIDDISDKLVPLIIIATEDHQGQNIDPTSGGPPFGNVVDLTIDLSIGLGGADGTVSMIHSEPELEAALDHMEWQVKRSLFMGLSVWSRWFHGSSHSVGLRCESWRSSIYRERELNVRLSARQIIAQIRLACDDDLVLGAGSPALPAPLGPLVDAVIADAGPYATTAAAIRDLILGSPEGLSPLVLPKLERVRMIEADQAATDDEHEGPAGNRHAGVAQADLT